jgi:hypothetical protein
MQPTPVTHRSRRRIAGLAFTFVLAGGCATTPAGSKAPVATGTAAHAGPSHSHPRPQTRPAACGCPMMMTGKQSASSGAHSGDDQAKTRAHPPAQPSHDHGP